MDLSKVIPRPPFANYDIVVYFGGGLFAIPFLNRYIFEPTRLRWPQFKVEMSSQIAGEIVAGLSLAFSIYIVGHILAYLGSQLVEKTMDRVLGKVSSAIIISSLSGGKGRDEAARALIFHNLKKIGWPNFKIAFWARAIFHLPAIPLYVLSFSLGVFGYYETRVPNRVLSVARERFDQLSLHGLKISLKTKWFKPLEYWVINRDPAATMRMYNYLVIGGLFRTVSFLFLVAAWLQIYYLIHQIADGEALIRPMLMADPFWSLLLEMAITLTLYLFALFSFIKFQRRYAEEAIFAFALGSSGD